MQNKISNIEWPEVALKHLKSIAEGWPNYASIKEGPEITLNGLSPNQNLVLTLFNLVNEINEIIENLNITINDLLVLSNNEKAFGENDKPFSRYKLIIRTFMYEYSRFEDMFGYFTLFLEKNGLLTKHDRRDLKNDFYEKHQDIIKIRNSFLHGAAEWKGHYNEQIILLQGAELFNLEVRDKDGNIITWQQHLSPLCRKMIKNFTDLGENMRGFWNLTLKATVHFLQTNKKLS